METLREKLKEIYELVEEEIRSWLKITRNIGHVVEEDCEKVLQNTWNLSLR